SRGIDGDTAELSTGQFTQERAARGVDLHHIVVGDVDVPGIWTGGAVDRDLAFGGKRRSNVKVVCPPSGEVHRFAGGIELVQAVREQSAVVHEHFTGALLH